MPQPSTATVVPAASSAPRCAQPSTPRARPETTTTPAAASSRAERARDVSAVVAAAARADDRDARLGEQLARRRAAEEQPRRRVADRRADAAGTDRPTRRASGSRCVRAPRGTRPRRTRRRSARSAGIASHARRACSSRDAANTARARSFTAPPSEPARRSARDAGSRELSPSATVTVPRPQSGRPTRRRRAPRSICATRATRARPRPESGSRSTARARRSCAPLLAGTAAPPSRPRAATTRLADSRRSLARLAPQARPRAAAAARLRGRSDPGAPARACRGSGRSAAASSVHSDGRIAAGAARAQVHRPDELESRGEDRAAADSRDGDRPVLERLAQGLEHRSRELRQLVEQEHAVVREGRLSRSAARHRRPRSLRSRPCGAGLGTAAS